MPSPRPQSGWQYLNNIQANRRVRIGAATAAIAATLYGSGAAQGVLEVFGQFQGAQASHYCEEVLETVTAPGEVTASCLNPLPEGQSGAILYGYDNIVFINETAAPATRISVCTATGANQPCTGTTAGSNVMSGVILEVANRIQSLVTSGSVVSNTPVVVAPRDYTGARRYLNFTFQYGSGDTVSGEEPAFARFEIVPCNLNGAGC